MHRASILIVLLLLPLFSHPAHAEKSKVLFVNSYHQGFRWSDDIEKGLRKALGLSGAAGREEGPGQSELRLRIFRMDTKRHQSETFKKQAALTAKHLIDDWRPDVVVASDDNAAKYLIVPYFKDSEIPFVFCGVNWSAADYGFPCSNVTGVLEVFPVAEALKILAPYARGDRVGFLNSDTLTERKNARHIRDLFKIDLVERYVTHMSELEQAYIEIQQACDILMIVEVVTVKDFDEKQLLAITGAHTAIPSFSFSEGHIGNFLLRCKRVPDEQGELAAQAALEILAGKSPADIPVTMNRKAAIRLNMEMAKKLNIKFPMDLIERATFTSEEVAQ